MADGLSPSENTPYLLSMPIEILVRICQHLRAPQYILPLRRVCRQLNEIIPAVLTKHIGPLVYPNYLEHFGPDLTLKILQEIANISTAMECNLVIHEFGSFSPPSASQRSNSNSIFGPTTMDDLDEEHSVIPFKNGLYVIKVWGDTIEIHRMRAVAGETLRVQLNPNKPVNAVTVNDKGDRIGVVVERGAYEDEEIEEQEHSSTSSNEGNELLIYDFDGQKLTQCTRMYLDTDLVLWEFPYSIISFLPPITKAGKYGKELHERIAVATWGVLEVWDVDTGECITIVDLAEQSLIHSILRNFTFVADDGSIKKIDVSKEELTLVELFKPSYTVGDIFYQSAGNLVQVIGQQGITTFIDADNGKKLLEVEQIASGRDLLFFPQLQRYVCFDEKGMMAIYNLQKEEVWSRTFNAPVDKEPVGDHILCIVVDESQVYFLNMKSLVLYETKLPELIARRRQNLRQWRLRTNYVDPNGLILIAKNHSYIFQFGSG